MFGCACEWKRSDVMCTYTYAIHAHNYSMHYSQCFQTQSLSLLHGRFMRHLSITEMPNTTCTHSRRSYVCVHTLGSIYKLGCVNFSLHQTIEGCLKGITIYYERSTLTQSHRSIWQMNCSGVFNAIQFTMVTLAMLMLMHAAAKLHQSNFIYACSEWERRQK